MSWRDEAKAVIDRVDASLRFDATYEERAAALFAAYPFGERKYTPYKTWLQERRKYLTKYSPEPAGPLDARPHLSNLDRQKLRSNPTLSRSELRRQGA